ncbi:MAG: hypothetical protein ABSH56_03585 [Bryobacteraceae bacterium]
MTTRFLYTRAFCTGGILAAAVLFTAGCVTQTAAAPPSLPTAGVVPVEQRDVPVYRE